MNCLSIAFLVYFSILNMNKTPLIRFGWLRVVIFLGIWLQIAFGANNITETLQNLLAEKISKEDIAGINLLVLAIINLVAGFIPVFIFRKLIDRRSFASLGFAWKGFQKHAWTGFFAALFILCAGSLILSLSGNLSFIDIDFYPNGLSISLLTMIIVAVGEEMIVRGYVLGNLMDSFPKWVALLISATLFSLFHFFNPSFTWLSLVGVFSGGLLLGINYIYTRNLWFGILLHLGWNFFLGPILGYPVSGLETDSLFVQSINGSPWLTGGAFGLEASAVACLLNLVVVAYFMLHYQRSPQRSLATA